MERRVEPEWLDDLAPEDVRAGRSRRDLRRLNAWMRHPAIMERALTAGFKGASRLQLADLGAGDGHFVARVAQRFKYSWSFAEAVLVDRLTATDPQSIVQLKALGWRIRVETSEVLAWLKRQEHGFNGAVISNLLLHQLKQSSIHELLRLAADSSQAVIALEPRRGWWPLFCSRMVGLAGCGPVTRHDAPISVRAGFRDNDLSALWPDPAGWTLAEGRAGWCSHLFVARRRI